jgi:hypothetical protein
MEVKFAVEELDGGIFCASLPNEEALGGREIGSLLEAAAPVKTADTQSSMRMVIAQFGAAGIFEAENYEIVQAHERLFGNRWKRAFFSSQMIRFCMEPYFSTESMTGGNMRAPYDWCHREDFRPENSQRLAEYLLEVCGTEELVAEQILARTLIKQYPGTRNYDLHQFIQLPIPGVDVPLNILVPNTEEYGVIDLSMDPAPAVMEPKLIWRQDGDSSRVPIFNSAAGLSTTLEVFTGDSEDFRTSQRQRLRYQDGTIGLILAAQRLGIHTSWPQGFGFKPEQLKSNYQKKRTIPMEAPQVPLLAQLSANDILNHPDFLSLMD